MSKRLAALVCISFAAFTSSPCIADESVNIAIASNFGAAARVLAESWEQQTGNQAVLSLGSSGKHYAQISNGAPFDVFLSADEKFPSRLENDGIARPNSRFTYARGKLVLWSREAGRIDNQGQALKDMNYRFLALANPRLAPYGQAAEALLKELQLFPAIEQRLVKGENVNQAFQFAWSRHAELALVAWSQVTRLPESDRGSYWLIPTDRYPAIVQQAVVLSDKPAARQFAEFLRSETGREIIRSYGYDIPHAD